MIAKYIKHTFMYVDGYGHFSHLVARQYKRMLSNVINLSSIQVVEV